MRLRAIIAHLCIQLVQLSLPSFDLGLMMTGAFGRAGIDKIREASKKVAKLCKDIFHAFGVILISQKINF